MFFNPVAAAGMNITNRGTFDTPDFAVGDLTLDNAWHDLDLSAIVPVNTKFVQLQCVLTNSTVGKYATINEKGLGQQYCIHKLHIQVSSIPIQGRFWIGIDSNRKLEYRMATTGWTVIDITVVAWLK